MRMRLTNPEFNLKPGDKAWLIVFYSDLGFRSVKAEEVLAVEVKGVGQYDPNKSGASSAGDWHWGYKGWVGNVEVTFPNKPDQDWWGDRLEGIVIPRNPATDAVITLYDHMRRTKDTIQRDAWIREAGMKDMMVAVVHEKVTQKDIDAAVERALKKEGK